MQKVPGGRWQRVAIQQAEWLGRRAVAATTQVRLW